MKKICDNPCPFVGFIDSHELHGYHEFRCGLLTKIYQGNQGNLWFEKEN